MGRCRGTLSNVDPSRVLRMHNDKLRTIGVRPEISSPPPPSPSALSPPQLAVTSAVRQAQVDRDALDVQVAEKAQRLAEEKARDRCSPDASYMSRRRVQSHEPSHLTHNPRYWQSRGVPCAALRVARAVSQLCTGQDVSHKRPSLLKLLPSHSGERAATHLRAMRRLFAQQMQAQDRRRQAVEAAEAVARRAAAMQVQVLIIAR